MNHLAHLLLAGSDEGLIAGAFLGDYIKGRLTQDMPGHVVRGIRLHRAIDAFTDSHRLPLESRQRFENRFRRFGSIMTDVIYDHFLAANWHEWHPDHLQQFSDRTFETLFQQREHFPEPAIKSCQRMFEHNSLVNYQDPEFIGRSLRYLSTRLSRENPLDEGFLQFIKQQEQLLADFRKFFPELISYTEHWKQQNT